MDITILIFLISVSFVLFMIGILLGGWARLGCGWLAGGLMLIIGMTVGTDDITSIVLFDPGVYETVSLGTGISNENFMIIFALMGFLMITYSTFKDT